MKTKLSITLLFAAALASCVKDTHFGESSYNVIKSFTVSGQIGATIYEGNNIYIAVDNDYNVTDVIPTIKISNFSTIIPKIGTTVDFTTSVEFTVTSESGIANTYKVWLYRINPEIQLPNSNFQHWHEASSSGKTYFQIGTSSTDTIWSTSNAGAASVSTPNVIPIVENGDTIPKLQTINTGVVPQILGQGIAAGSLFTGTFKINLANPASSARFGTPFVARPKSFSVKYKYQSGATLLNGKGQELAGKDSLDIYVLLENRSSQPWKRVATAWFRSPEAQPEWLNLTVQFIYGEISNPKSYEIPTNGTIWGVGTEKPTHISVVFSSSARGNLFEGAPGSTLWVTNFELTY